MILGSGRRGAARDTAGSKVRVQAARLFSPSRICRDTQRGIGDDFASTEPVLVTITNGKRRRLRKTALSLLIIVSILAAFGAVIISQLLDKTHQIAQVSTGANASGDAKVSTDGKVSSEAKALTSKGMAALEHSDYAQALTWFRKAADQGD